MPLLFSYGSNHPEQLKERVGPVRAVQGAYAPHHKRVFCGWSSRWSGGVASLEPSNTRPAYGYLCRVTEQQLAELDRFEGVHVGKYERRIIPVIVDGDEVAAVAYIATPATASEFNPPSAEYLAAVYRTISTFWKMRGPEEITVEAPRGSTGGTTGSARGGA